MLASLALASSIPHNSWAVPEPEGLSAMDQLISDPVSLQRSMEIPRKDYSAGSWMLVSLLSDVPLVSVRHDLEVHH